MSAGHRLTKAEFEQMMNAKYGISLESKGSRNQYAAKTRPYGTYLRNQDREMFNACYFEYLETGEL